MTDSMDAILASGVPRVERGAVDDFEGRAGAASAPLAELYTRQQFQMFRCSFGHVSQLFGDGLAGILSSLFTSDNCLKSELVIGTRVGGGSPRAGAKGENKDRTAPTRFVKKFDTRKSARKLLLSGSGYA